MKYINIMNHSKFPIKLFVDLYQKILYIALIFSRLVVCIAKKKRVAICIMAYEAVNTLDKVIDLIPPQVKDMVGEIYLLDDASNDNTYYAALGYKSLKGIKKLKVYKNEKNLGCGGNQKKAYNYAIRKGFDVLAMLHGDNQYDPRCLPYLLKPLLEGKADFVYGSRMTRDALKGGMPLYKYLGNRFLTIAENWLLGMNLSEYHSGYRLYNVHALKKVPFNRCSDDFHFDTEIIIQFKKAGIRIKDLPIPTFYGDEISRVKVIKYGFNVLKAVIEYRLHEAGIIKSHKFDF